MHTILFVPLISDEKKVLKNWQLMHLLSVKIEKTFNSFDTSSQYCKISFLFVFETADTNKVGCLYFARLA
jgi:hypothetical protein